MGRRPQQPLRPLSGEEQDTLERLIKASSARRDQARRARALCAVARGSSYREAAGQAGYRDEGSVSRLVGRFNARGLGALSIGPGRGRKVTYGAGERGVTPDRGDDDPAGVARGGEFVPTHADVVPDGHRSPHTQKWSRPGHRSRHGEKRGRIEQA